MFVMQQLYFMCLIFLRYCSFVPQTKLCFISPFAIFQLLFVSDLLHLSTGYLKIYLHVLTVCSKFHV